MVAMTQAMDMYSQSPPPGREADPFVVGAMADALALLLRPADRAEPTDPVLFGPSDLPHLMRLWQTWLWLAELDRADPPHQPTRAMVLWAATQADVDELAGRGFIVHHPAGAADDGWLFHVGSWPVASTSVIADAVDIPPAPGGPVALYLAAWGGPSSFTISLRGMFTDRGMEVQACSHPGLLDAVLASLNDPGLAGGPVAARDDIERQAILAVAEQAGRLDAIVVDRGMLGVAGADVVQTDYAPRTRWLADLASYVRYGRDAMVAAGR
jgi:hypothetical protein